jgi:formate dehydrogenase subunit gamma
MTSASYEPWSPALCAEVLEAHRGQEGSLLPILHDIQHRVGWVPPEATPLIAEALNLSRADVHGVVSFYHDFRHEPAGRTVVKLCQAEACQSRGSRALTAHAETKLGVAMGETSADGAVTLEPIYCLGLCASGPAALIDDKLCARLDPARFDILVEEAVR